MKKLSKNIALFAALAFASSIAAAQSSSWVQGDIGGGGTTAGRYGNFNAGVTPFTLYGNSTSRSGGTYTQLSGEAGVAGSTAGRNAGASGSFRTFGYSDASQAGGRGVPFTSNSSNSVGMEANVVTNGNAQASGGGSVFGASGASAFRPGRGGGKG